MRISCSIRFYLFKVYLKIYRKIDNLNFFFNDSNFMDVVEKCMMGLKLCFVDF